MTAPPTARLEAALGWRTAGWSAAFFAAHVFGDVWSQHRPAGATEPFGLCGDTSCRVVGRALLAIRTPRNCTRAPGNI
jgi:hypothetical protein